MKKLNFTSVFYLFAFLFVTSFGYSQRMVSANEVTSQFLKETFDNAFIEVLEVKDTYIKVKDVYNMYLDIDKNQRYVAISSTYNLVDGTSPAKALALMNKINAEVALIKVYYNQNSNSITYYYYFWTDGGFTQKSLISAFRLYKSALTVTLEKDTERLIK